MFHPNQTQIAQEQGVARPRNLLIEISETAQRVLSRESFSEMLAAVFKKMMEEPEGDLWVIKTGGLELWGLFYENEEPDGADRLVIM